MLAQGRGEEALAVTAEEPEGAFRFWALAIVLHVLGRRSESEEALRQLIAEYAEGGAYQIAQVYAARGEADAMFSWLERAYAQCDAGLAGLLYNYEFRSLHADPRWKAFLRKVGFEE